MPITKKKNDTISIFDIWRRLFRVSIYQVCYKGKQNMGGPGDVGQKTFDTIYILHEDI